MSGPDTGQLTAGEALLSVVSCEPAEKDVKGSTGDRAAEERRIPLHTLEGRPADSAAQL